MTDEIKDKYSYKYDPAICETLPQMFEEGQAIVEVAKELGISKRCFYDWRAQHPEFAEAVEEGLSRAEAWWAYLGRGGAMGKVPVNSAVWIFNMKNRYKWTDRVETDNRHEHTGIEDLMSKIDGRTKTID